MKAIIIEIPNIERIKKNTEETARRDMEERIAKYQRRVVEGWESLPKLIAYLTQSIEENSKKGISYLGRNIADSTFNKNEIDPRIDFVFKGYFTTEMAEKIEEIFTISGYEISVRNFSYVNSNCYRTACIKIYW